MVKKQKILYIVLFALLVFVSAGWFTSLQSKGTRDFYSDVRWNIQIFGEIYKALNERYIKELDPEKFMRAGIDGMLSRLDPYTVYLERESQDEIQIMTRGKYYGVGMRIVIRNGWATVAEPPFPDTPAFRAGIREGDQIIEIDGESTKGWKLSETARRLRGKEKGSEVTIKIRRVGEPEPLIFTLIRDEIVVPDIDYAGFVEPGIGFVQLSRFNRGAGRQLREVLEDLKDEGMEAVILDLRGNPGGLLDVAVSVADNFLPKGDLVVYTEGRDKRSRQEYRAQRTPVVGGMPLAVLIDGFSASASEIVAGAIQDLDRGVIVGRESFGKGLVQTVIPLDRHGRHQLKMTTAQYFIPSGRLIQRPDVFKKGPNSVFLDDEEGEKEEETEKEPVKYYTKNKRVVWGGGGIKPDVEVESEPTTRYVVALLRRSMFFNFSLQYVSEHPDLPKDFQVTDAMVDEFMAFVKEKEFEYKPTGFEEFEKLEKVAQENGFYDAMTPHFQAIRSEFENVKEKEIRDSRKQIKIILKREIAGKLFGSGAATEAMFPNDPTVRKAVEILKDAEQYRRILNIDMAMKN